MVFNFTAHMAGCQVISPEICAELASIKNASLEALPPSEECALSGEIFHYISVFVFQNEIKC